MSRSPSAAEDQTFLLEYRCHPLRSGPPAPTSPPGKRNPDSAMSCFPMAEPRRIVLSTDSPAALKVGTQQLIPRSLAVSTKTKNPTRNPSTGSIPDAACLGQKRTSVPSVTLQEDTEEDGGGMLKRNLRNMSYRAAMKGTGTEMEPVSTVPTLKPLLEEGSAPPARSPGRSKKNLGRKRVQKHGGSFKDQPRLYQEIRERGLNSVSHESDEDLLEEPNPEEPSLPGAAIVVRSYRPAQVTWSQLPEVLEADLLKTIKPEERKRQEAMFEIITSEFSYMHSLSVLVGCFKKSEELKETMTQTEHHHLFSNISDILAVSTNFFQALEKRHQENVLIPDISDIVEEHASKHFNPYISYCSNEVYQQRTLQRLLNTNPLFKEALKQIERKPECGGLPLISFLILPMQRVTRLPLLLDTVCQKTQACTAAYGAATRALKAISKVRRAACSPSPLSQHSVSPPWSQACPSALLFFLLTSVHLTFSLQIAVGWYTSFHLPIFFHLMVFFPSLCPLFFISPWPILCPSLHCIFHWCFPSLRTAMEVSALQFLLVLLGPSPATLVPSFLSSTHSPLCFSSWLRTATKELVRWRGQSSCTLCRSSWSSGRRRFSPLQPFPLISASRWLLKRGELYLLSSEEGGIFRKGSGRVCHLFLFNDVLIITKKKSEESYTVMNYAMLDQISVEKMETTEPPSPPPGRPGGHLLRVAMERDSEGRREEVLLSAETLSDRARWVTALMHREREQPDSTPRGDLSQVEITRAYMAKQADEISLQQADVVLLLGEEDGWCWGERLRDGERGWFPQACARPITSRVAVECNVRRMERLRIETDV
ncbi:rho guanine nucleotide exchange factor 16 isoform X1 [Tympanuchus pallidicinctus]|uniref:rho guanine nucleotide exchange factor 16 isoform X1 n=1 Tax=Tympanuchus pallidicinctus TaxID=109042 RepID=UPI002286E78F|nr:rho guanine nucleotide exchange factor 16 isoform X1 [Tympanuchus pallidicinctus]XP_052547934.1 rho guanine nucleotide exchange factor 16 isoform X1 [Tympanuchus pallidicinctus]XP_052547938.1 rho guanine nucleotide exchange factor 16 isoform X1 [Tympanuchus pallidicinctus]